MRERKRPSFGFERFSGLYLGAFFVVLFGIWTPHLFLTVATAHTVASSEAVVGMLAIAVLAPLAAGVFDVSIGANITLATLLAVTLQVDHHWSAGVAVGFAIGISTLVGALNGFIVVRLKVNSFIATLGTMSVLQAFVAIVSPNQPAPVTTGGYVSLATKEVAGFQIVVIYLLVLALVVWWFLEHSAVGRRLYAVGGNPEAARLSGVNVGRLTWLTYIMSGAIAGIAGVFYGSQYGPSLTFGSALLLPAYAAAFLGSTQLKPGRFNVWGTIIAIYVLAVGVQGLSFVTSAQWTNDMFDGVALIGAVAFATWRQDATRSGKLLRRRPPAAAEEEARPHREEPAVVDPVV